ncbi:MAG: sterol desaturase family protein [Panacagrimonas sp.]
MEPSPDFAELLRPAIFFALLAVIGSAERWYPVRLSDPQRPLRWPSNFGLVALGSVLLMVLQLSSYAVSAWAQVAGFGLFNRTGAPLWIELVLAWLLLDLVIYWQHRAFHEIRWLWPLHRVHHSDVEFDVTTGLRFHPGELLASQLFKMGVIAMLGAPWLAVLLFEIGLSSFALFTHANLRLPPAFERVLRWLFVTPDMHRTHHSTHRFETDSNYGNVLSMWDHLFRSYTREPHEGHREMRIGLSTFRVPSTQNLASLLVQPLER